MVDDGREWLDAESTAMENLRTLFAETRWMKSLGYYARNRHTENIEVLLN